MLLTAKLISVLLPMTTLFVTGSLTPKKTLRELVIARTAATNQPQLYDFVAESASPVAITDTGVDEEGDDDYDEEEEASPDDDLSSIFTITITFVLPNPQLANPSIRNQLRQYLADGLVPPKSDVSNNNNKDDGAVDIRHRLQVNPVYTTGLSVSQTVNNIFCSRTAKGMNALLIMTDKSLQGDEGTRISNFLTTLAAKVGIPTLAWSTSSFELEQSRDIEKNRILLAPKLRDQAMALFDYLKAQPFQRVTLIGTKTTPGFDIFASDFYELADAERRASRYVDIHRTYSTLRLVHTVKLKHNWRWTIRDELTNIRDQVKTATIILYAKADEANEILGEARTLGMTAEEYHWICCKTVLGDQHDNQKVVSFSQNFVPGTVVFTYDISYRAQLDILKGATHIWSIAARRLMHKLLTGSPSTASSIDTAAPAPFCNESTSPPPWQWHDTFVEMLKHAKEELERGDEPEIQETGRIILKYLDAKRQWVPFGQWKPRTGLWSNATLYQRIKAAQSDSAVLRIVTLEEAPYIIYGPTDHAGGCPRSALPCEVAKRYNEGGGVEDNHTLDHTTTTMRYPFVAEPPVEMNKTTEIKCCSGFCIDLLQKLAHDIGFKFHLFEVPDRKWGVQDKVTGNWTGLIKSILDNEADLIMTSIKVNKERSEAIDFGIPFLETGITMVVAVRPGAISPMAFMEPFSPTAWMAILFGCVNAVVISGVLFEYLSVRGLDWGVKPYLRHLHVTRNAKNHEHSKSKPTFSLLWLAWAMLFKAAVRVHVPKSLGAKLLIAVWGAFCVIFSSSYMANLAVFMITKDEYYDFSGIEDNRLINPYTKNPPFRFGTLGSGATEAFMRQNYPEMFEYMRQYNQSSPSAGIEAVKAGQLDAFIYDATVLEFKSSRDKECRLTTVGKWYATTGYAVGFPKGSKWQAIFDKYIIDYQHNSFLQQQMEFWLGGACKRKTLMQDKNKAFQLGIGNFASAFVLLILGLGVCLLLLIIETFFAKYLRRHVGMSTLRAAIKRQFIKKYKSSPNKFDLATIGFSAISCKNCGGRGHFAAICSSPRMALVIKEEEIGKLRPLTNRNLLTPERGKLLHHPSLR